MTQLRFFRLHPQVKLPAKQTTQSACFDLSFQGYAHNTYEGYSQHNKTFKRVMNNQIVIQPGDRVMVPTGVIMDIPEGYSVRLHARSGLSYKQGLVLANAEGIIDSDYVQEVMVLVHNITENQIVIHSGDRIAQGELVKDTEYSIVESATRPILKSNRTGGMGSTGISTNGPEIIIKVAEPKPAIPEKKEPKVPVKKATNSVAPRGRGRPRKA